MLDIYAICIHENRERETEREEKKTDKLYLCVRALEGAR